MELRREEEEKWRQKYPSLSESTTADGSENRASKRRRHDEENSAENSEKPAITAKQWEHFDREGWVVLPKEQVFENLEEFEEIQSRIEDIQMGKADVPYDKMMMQLDSSTGDYGDAGEQTVGFKGACKRYRKIQNLDNCPVIMRYLRKPIFKEACQRLYGQIPIASFRTMFFNKPCKLQGNKAGGTRLPWHQDRWKYLDRDPTLNVYLAIDPAVPESGCMSVVPRSHKLGILNPGHHSSFLTEEQAKKHCGPATTELLTFVLHPGEVALMHNWLVHCSGTNTTSRDRRALSISFMDARTELRTDEFHKFVGGDLKSSGYPEGGTEFPVIFKSEEMGGSQGAAGAKETKGAPLAASPQKDV